MDQLNHRSRDEQTEGQQVRQDDLMDMLLENMYPVRIVHEAVTCDEDCPDCGGMVVMIVPVEFVTQPN